MSDISIFGPLDDPTADEALIAPCVPYSAPSPAVENEYSEIFWDLFTSLNNEVSDLSDVHCIAAINYSWMAVVDLNQIDPSQPEAWAQFLAFCRSHLRNMQASKVAPNNGGSERE